MLDCPQKNHFPNHLEIHFGMAHEVKRYSRLIMTSDDVESISVARKIETWVSRSSFIPHLNHVKFSWKLIVTCFPSEILLDPKTHYMQNFLHQKGVTACHFSRSSTLHFNFFTGFLEPSDGNVKQNTKSEILELPESSLLTRHELRTTIEPSEKRECSHPSSMNTVVVK
jgi:hypothetical protein